MTTLTTCYKRKNCCKPLGGFVRFEGNNAAAGRKILADSGLNIIPAGSLAEAAEKSVAAAGGAA